MNITQIRIQDGYRRFCIVLFSTSLSLFFVAASSPLPSVPPEALSGWENLRTTVQHDAIMGRFRYRRTGSIPGEKSSHVDRIFEFGINKGGWFLKEEGTTKLVAVNDDYAFEANRASPEDKFEIKTIRRGNEANAVRPRIRDICGALLFSGYEIFGKTMPALVSDDKFALQSLTYDEAAETATMNFTYSKSPKPDTALTGGSVVFTKNNNWAIQSFDCTTVWGRVEGTVRCRSFEGFLVPEYCERTMYGTENKSVVHDIYELEEILKVSDNAVAIRLEDYGMSEPTAEIYEKKSTMRLYLIVLNAFLVAFLLVVYFRFKRKKSLSKL